MKSPFPSECFSFLCFICCNTSALKHGGDNGKCIKGVRPTWAERSAYYPRIARNDQCCLMFQAEFCNPEEYKEAGTQATKR